MSDAAVPEPVPTVGEAEAELEHAMSDLVAATGPREAPAVAASEAPPAPDTAPQATEAPVAAPDQAPPGGESVGAPFAAAQEPSTEELLANAPPLVLPSGTKIVKTCTNCGLHIEDTPTGVLCPNCGTPLP